MAKDGARVLSVDLLGKMSVGAKSNEINKICDQPP